MAGLEDEGNQRLRWSFGKTLQEEMSEAYIMQCSAGPNDELLLEWLFDGHRCTARFLPTTQVGIFEFLLETCVIVVTYRITRPDMMAVCIVEVNEGSPPSIQYGNMIRVDPAHLQKHSAAGGDSAK